MDKSEPLSCGKGSGRSRNLCAFYRLPLTVTERHPRFAFVAGVLGARPDEAVAVQMLDHVGGPTSRTRDGEDG